VPWCHLTRDLQIVLQVIEGKTHPRPNDYVSDQHWNFMTRCWSMTYSDRPSAKEAGQFVGSALHPSTSLQSPSISSDEQNPGITRDEDAVRAESGCFTCRVRRMVTILNCRFFIVRRSPLLRNATSSSTNTAAAKHVLVSVYNVLVLA
jgi:hypothetical protein